MVRLKVTWFFLPLVFLLPATLIAETTGAQTPERAVEASRLEPQQIESLPTGRLNPMGLEQRALAAIREESRLRVRALADQMQVLPDGPERRELQLQAIALKLEYRLRFLQTKIEFARARGDLTAADRVESIIERIRRPRLSAPTPERAKALPTTSLKGGRP